MAEPVVVTIPHKLGKQEATRRLQEGFKNVRSTFGEKFVVMKDNWNGDHLDFSASLLGQNTTGMLDVAEDHVRLEVQLPWMLAMFANKAKALVKKQGQLMLEKPTKPTTTRLKLSDSDDLGFADAGLDSIADLFPHQRLRDRRHVRQRAERRIGLVLADDAIGLAAPVLAEDGHGGTELYMLGVARRLGHLGSRAT